MILAVYRPRQLPVEEPAICHHTVVRIQFKKARFSFGADDFECVIVRCCAGASIEIVIVDNYYSSNCLQQNGIVLALGELSQLSTLSGEKELPVLMVLQLPYICIHAKKRPT